MVKALPCLLFPLCLLFSSTFISLPQKAFSQTRSFDNLINVYSKALTDIQGSVDRAFRKDAWCAASRCDGECVQHVCSAGIKPNTCSKDFNTNQCDAPKSVTGHTSLCSESEIPFGTLMDYTSAAFRTPTRNITSEGEGKPIKVIGDDLKRDLCAMKKVNPDIVKAFSDNELVHWLYVGTTNKAFSTYPASTRCRKSISTTPDPLSTCEDYDPTNRPWYISAASGPRNVVFLFDETSLPLSGSKLRDSLKKTLESFDSRDKVAVISYSGSEKPTTVLKSDSSGELQLKAATAEVIETLRDEIDKLKKSDTLADISLVLAKAFDFFIEQEQSSSLNECTSSKFIVLLQGNEDACTNKCESEATCKCASEVIKVINEKQAKWENPAAVVTFVENGIPGTLLTKPRKISKLNRMSRSIACESSNSSIHYTVRSNDENDAALQVFNQFSSVSRYAESPNVFSSRLYPDASGLGELFTLSLPVYVDRQLVAVIATDITIGTVIQTLNISESEAKVAIDAASRSSRICATDEGQDKCNFKIFQQQYDSICPPPPAPSDSGKCFSYNKEGISSVFIKQPSVVTHEIAEASCNALIDDSDDSSDFARLAVVPNEELNELLGSLYSPDGSWIGLKAVSDTTFKWTDGNTVIIGGSSYEAFNSVLDNSTVSEILSSGGDACVTADRRGIDGNWEIESCRDKSHEYICEVSKSLAGRLNICDVEVSIDRDRCLESTVLGGRMCSSSDNEAIQDADPLCKQEGKSYTELDRTCCHGRMASNPNPKNKMKLSLPVIIAIAVGGILLLGVIIIVLRKKPWRTSGQNQFESNIINNKQAEQADEQQQYIQDRDPPKQEQQDILKSVVSHDSTDSTLNDELGDKKQGSSSVFSADTTSINDGTVRPFNPTDQFGT